MKRAGQRSRGRKAERGSERVQGAERAGVYILYSAVLPSTITQNGVIAKAFADDLKIYRAFSKN